MKKIYLLLFIYTFSISYSQVLEYGNSIESIKICNVIQGKNFASERAADSALDDILNVIGASKRFVLKECSNINNAVALTLNGVRYIMYDPEFMTSLSYGENWTNKFILAHEVGHHINGHTVDVLVANSSKNVSLSTNRIQELEADEFAGFVLGRLGATLSDALAGVQSLSDEDDSYSTHPRRSKRIAAIKKGFNESGGYVNPSNGTVKNGKTVDSPYSNLSYSGVVFQTRNDIFSDGIYTGYIGVNSDKPFGYGTFYGNSGYKYEGEWADGQNNGYGKRTYASGATEEGFFVNGYFSGAGVYTFANGTRQVGNFVKGSLNGEGEIIFNSGTVLKGTFNNGSIIKVTLTNPDDPEKIEIGFLDGSGGDGYATYTDHNGSTYTGNWKNGQIVTEAIKKHKDKGYKKWARQTGLDHFIPDFVLKGLDIQFSQGYGDDYIPADRVGFLIKKQGGSTLKGYFKNSFWRPIRSGFIETKIHNPDLENWDVMKKYGLTKYDLAYSIYWDDDRNGYAAFFLNGKLVQKGIYQGGNLVKEEDFDLELMIETYKQF